MKESGGLQITRMWPGLLVGSKVAALQKEALAVVSMSIANRIRIEPERVLRSKNQQAEYMSQLVDYDDGQIHPSIFAQLEQLHSEYTLRMRFDDV